MVERLRKRTQRRWWSTMNNNLAIATVLFIIGQGITWFSSYSQFFWEWAKEHTFLIAVTTAIPSALCFIYGLKYAYRYFQNGWAPRFYIFSLSFLVMPFLFWYFMGERFFTTKNILSFVLASGIIYIQMRYK